LRAQKNPWARRRKVALTELLNESWVLPSPGGPVGSFAQSVFRAGGVDYPRATVFAPTPEIRMELVKTGRFLTIVSSSALKFPTKEPGIKVLPIKLRFNNAPIGIVTLKNRTLSTIAQRFVDDALVAAKLLESGKL
jgi:DNA-binding transcriptional LysR family regulator